MYKLYRSTGSTEGQRVLTVSTMRISASLLLCQLTFRLASTQSCNVGSKCKSQEECPRFLEQRKELKKLQDSGDSEGYQVLLKDLQGKVCDGPQKKVCCGECGFTSTDPSFVSITKTIHIIFVYFH